MIKRFLPLALVVASLATPTTVGAEGVSINEAVGQVAMQDDLFWHRYDSGPRLDIEPSASDVYVDSVRNTGDPSAVELDVFLDGSNTPDVAAVGWADLDLQVRQCATVTGTGQQFMDLSFDSTAPVNWESSGLVQSDWGDVIPVLDTGASQTTPPFWLATPFDTDDGHAYVLVDFAVVGSPVELCLYFASQTGGRVPASNPQLGQNWGTMEALYTRNNELTGNPISISNPTLTPVRVSTSPGGVTTSIPAGGVISYDMGTVDTLFADGVVQTRGPNTTLDDDSLAPTTFSSDTFVSATRRRDQRWCIGDTPTGTVITIDPSSGPAVNYTYNPATPCITVDTTQATVLTSSIPFNVVHTAGRNDNYVLYAPTVDWLYGVASRTHFVATDTPGTTVVRERSNGTSTTHTISANGASIGGSGTQGTGPSERIRSTSSGAIASIQEADSDGNEATTFLPMSELAARYVINQTAQYVTIACPHDGQALTIGGAPVTCGGTGLGHARQANVAAGTVIESVDGAAFYIYAEVNNDESNYFSPRLDWAQVDITSRSLESLYDPSGTWTSVGAAVTEVWGLLDSDLDLPLDTTVTGQISCGGTSVGPWTPPIAWSSGDVVPHECDATGFLQVTMTLTTFNRTQTPQVLDVRVEYDLVREADSTAPFDLVSVGRTWLWRVHDHSGFYAAAPTSIAPTTSATTGAYVLTLVDSAMNGSTQVIASGGGAAEGGGADVTLDVSSLRADVTTLPSSVDDHTWELTVGPAVSRIVRLV